VTQETRSVTVISETGRTVNIEQPRPFKIVEVKRVGVRGPIGPEPEVTDLVAHYILAKD
jgi:hypothetical protein